MKHKLALVTSPLAEPVILWSRRALPLPQRDLRQRYEHRPVAIRGHWTSGIRGPSPTSIEGGSEPCPFFHFSIVILERIQSVALCVFAPTL